MTMVIGTPFAFKSQTAFGLPKPQTVCIGECSFYYIPAHERRLKSTLG